MKAGIVGVGKLGGSVGFTLARDVAWDELVLCDTVEGLAWAQAEDIRHGLDVGSTAVVRAGTISQLGDADVVVIAAGQGRKPGMTRLDLLHANAGLVASLSKEVAQAAPGATLVILTNPMDVMTTVAWRASGLPRERIVGSGTLLDSVRLRALLADRFHVRPSEVEATVLGEHGDRAVPIFSQARVRQEPVALTSETKEEIAGALRDVAGRVIEVKGGTAFGPAGCTTALVRALMAPSPSVVPASVVLRGEYGLREVAMGVPAVLGQGRVLRVEEWDLRSDEQAALQEAGHDLARFAEDAAVVLGLAVRHTTLEKFTVT